MESQRASIKANLQRIAIGSYIFQSELAQAFGLHPRDLHAISCLSLSGTLTAGELSEMLNLTSGATTALINRLIEGGFARRRSDPHDGRRVLVDSGGPNIARLRARYAAIEAKIELALEGFSAKEITVISNFLAKMTTS